MNEEMDVHASSAHPAGDCCGGKKPAGAAASTASLVRRSLEVIRENQHSTGAYVACPTFSAYQYCWVRDGCFIAYAMSRYGERDSADAFYRWAARAVGGALKVRSRLPEGILPARYRLDGNLDGSEWPQFQLDGYGTLLWAAIDHLHRAGLSAAGGAGNDASNGASSRAGRPVQPGDGERCASLAEALHPVLVGVGEYLAENWRRPNFDCWEEHPDQVHLSTLGCIAAGLRDLAGYLQGLGDVDRAARFRAVYGQVVELIQGEVHRCGYVPKWVGSEAVDASGLWLMVPFGIVAPDSEAGRATAAKIARDLGPQGIHRYRADTYYGGGAWILLTAWMGWYEARTGARSAAEGRLRWIEEQADAGGLLPEQVPEHLNDPAWFAPWVERWGPVAKPLLWSHAMYLVLAAELGQGHIAAQASG
ncbi:MAG: glycoside hydrolase family 15 protein [Firmicutes bacterium]|nr:glycoside hydrolase family 15 protein [Bacillota bacterium]